MTKKPDETTGADTSKGEVGSEDASKSGNAGDQARDAQPKSDVEKLNMEWKDKATALNNLLAKHGVSSVEELTEKLSQSPAARDDEEDEEDPEADEQEVAAMVDTWAKKGDPVARYTKKLEEKLDRLTAGVTNAITARDIEDKTLRDRVIAHYKRNRARFKNLGEAYAEVERADLKKEVTKLRDELVRLKKEPDPDVKNAPKTFGREITAQEINEIKRMTVSEFDNKVAALRSEGRFRDAMALQRRYRLDQIELTPG